MLPIDHIIWATSDLATACEQFADMSGIRPKFGGKHSDGLTENSLVRLGDRRYLEILAAQPGADLSDPWVKFCADSHEPRLMTYCLNPPSPMDALAKAAADQGLSETNIYDGGRMTPDGKELSWTLCAPEDPAYGFFMPFFIDWGGEHHPSTDAPDGITIADFQVGHPDADGLNTHLRALGLPAAVNTAPKPTLTLVLNTPKGAITLV